MNLMLTGPVICLKAICGDLFRVPPGMTVEFQDLTDAQRLALKYNVKKLFAEDILEFQEEPVIFLDDA
ncbi:MAG: hypothetical protein OHK006_14330 [Thermodesulfovibrionales bacterium]